MNNEPVFPNDHETSRVIYGDRYPDGLLGIRMRDYIAIKAMQGIISEGSNKHFESVAENSYRYAEAMLKERMKYE